jgi:hypothetical protein
MTPIPLILGEQPALIGVNQRNPRHQRAILYRPGEHHGAIAHNRDDHLSIW